MTNSIVNIGSTSLTVECPCCQTEFNNEKIKYHTQHLLFAACECNNINLVSELLYNITDNINSLSDDGWSPLGIVCHNGHIDVVDLLLDHPNIDVNATARIANGYSYTALHLAVQHHNLNIISLLLDHVDININKKVLYNPKNHTITFETTSALDIAVGKEDIDTILLLLEQPNLEFLVHCEEEDNYYNRSNNHDDIKYQKYANYHSFLHHLICEDHGFVDSRQNGDYNNEELAIQLIEACFDREDYDLDINQNYNLSFVCRTIIMSQLKIAEYLLKRLLEHSSSSSCGIITNTAYRLLTTLKIVCYQNSQISEYDRRTKVITHGKQRLFNYVLTHYTPDINKVNKDGNTVLHLTCIDTEYDVTEGLMVIPSLNVNLRNYKGKTALELCVEDNNYYGVRFLCSRLDLNVNVNVNNNVNQNNNVVNHDTDEDSGEEDEDEGDDDVHNNDIKTILDVIYRRLIHELDYDNPDCEENEGILIMANSIFSHANVDVNIKFSKASTLLHIACFFHLNDAIKHLITKIDINARDRFSLTPLMEFCRCDSIVDNQDYNIDILKLLLCNPNIDLNVEDERLHTVLYFVADNRNREVLKYVIAAGAYRYDKTNLHLVADPFEIQGYKLIKMYLDTPSLLHDYKVEVDRISKVYTSVVLLNEGYYRLNTSQVNKTSRFYAIASQLPLDVQMVLCYRLFNSTKQNIADKLFLAQAKKLLT
jgi:ankyrin repeat protein